MSFKTRPIRKKPPLSLRSGPVPQILQSFKKAPVALAKGIKGTKKSTFRYIWIGILVILAFWMVIKVTLGAYHLITNFKATAKEVVFSAGSDLKTDQYGYTNIVLLGDGGLLREGAGLVDTIMVASIDHEKNAVTLLSIPRDYYVGRNGVGIGKINEVYLANKKDKSEEGGYAAYEKVVGNIVNLDIQYFVRVDFNAFVEIVDSLGGVTVDVQKAIYDPEYPNATDTGHDPFKLDAGIQELDGETALKYARSRHSIYDSSADYGRAARQQQLLAALQEKALSAGVLTNPSTLKDVFDAVQNNMDTNMSWRELLSLAQFADQFDRSHLLMKGLTEYRNQEGGFLGAGNRELYGGFVLLPYDGDLEMIRQYADLIFHHREIYFDTPDVQILNGTKIPGLAGDVRDVLNRFGFNVVKVGNHLGPDGEKQPVDETMLFYYSWAEEEDGIIPTYDAYLKVLQGFIPSVALPANVHELKEDVDLTLVLGADYKEGTFGLLN